MYIMPDLVGNTRQIALAEKIRKSAINTVETAFSDFLEETNRVPQADDVGFIDWLKSINRAGWWLEHQSDFALACYLHFPTRLRAEYFAQKNA